MTDEEKIIVEALKKGYIIQIDTGVSVVEVKS